MHSRTRADIFAPVMEEIPGTQDAAPALSLMSTVVVDSGDLQTFCGKVMDAAATMLGADCASIQTKVPAQPALHLLGERGFAPEATAFWQRVEAGSGSACGQALSRGHRILVPDVERDQVLAGTDDLRHLRICGIRAVQSTPLVTRNGACVGMLSTHWRRPYQPPEGVLRLLDVVASHVAALMERVAVEEALRASEAALRLRVAALEAADREKNDFLAVLGHELRNPLAPISNVGEFLARLLHDHPAAQRPLAILRRQTEQLTRLVEDLVDITRIQEGRMTLDERPVEIGTVVDQAIETVQPLLREKEQRLNVGRLPSAVYVLGDRARLVQCVGNLLHNAVKYTEAAGEISVEVQEPDSRVSIVVSDNGAGIAPTVLPHIFNPFVQSEETLENARGGLGLGLAIVKRLVEMHGGSVEAASRGAGHGSTFAIHLRRLGAAQTRDT
jgi:signal transduction histidine kinase